MSKAPERAAWEGEGIISTGDSLLCVPEGVCVGDAAVLEVYQEGRVGCVCQSPPSSHHGQSS